MNRFTLRSYAHLIKNPGISVLDFMLLSDDNEFKRVVEMVRARLAYATENPERGDPREVLLWPRARLPPNYAELPPPPDKYLKYQGK